MHQPAHRVEVALVGKYVDLPDAYLSVTEALRAGGFAQRRAGRPALGGLRHLRDARGCPAACSAGVDAVCVPGGFGVRGIEGKVGALRWARENQVPALGLCLGLQCMVIEFARHVAGLDGASSTEFDPRTPHPVIATMEEQKHIVDGAGDLGGTMRLGSYPAVLAEGSRRARGLRRRARSRSGTGTATR